MPNLEAWEVICLSGQLCGWLVMRENHQETGAVFLVEVVQALEVEAVASAVLVVAVLAVAVPVEAGNIPFFKNVSY